MAAPARADGPERTRVPQILVIRFGSLGDLCLLAWTLAGLDAQGGAERAPRVTLVTKQAYAPLLSGAPGVHEIVPLPAGGPRALLALARRLRARRFDAVVDAHAVLRSHALLALLGRRADRRLRKDTAARLALLRGRREQPALDRRLLDRYDAALGHVAGVVAAAPGAALLADGSRPPLRPRGSAGAGAAPARLGLAPGARWDTKRWPPEHFAALLSGFRGLSAAPVSIFLGAREQTWFEGGPLDAAARGAGGVAVRRALPLPQLAAELAACTVLVTNDSGLLHLAEAAGTPVLAMFGPTVRAFGYFPLLPSSRALEVADLDCRPCSRNGKRPCHRRDLACLTRLSPAAVLAQLAAMADWPDAGSEVPDA